MDRSGAYDFNSRRRRRDDKKRRRVEAAVERLMRRYRLPPRTAQAMSEWIYKLYRILVALKSLDDQNRYYRKWKHRAEHKLAVRTADASGADTDVSAYVANAREFAAQMIRLESLERGNLGRGKAIERASKTTWAELSPQERRKARLYLEADVLPGDKTRQPAREREFLNSVAGLIEHATGHRIRFSSAPGSTVRSTGRHHGVEFDVMMAATEMADYRLTNEAMARLIQRIRRR
jgi:hypothetical protein